MKRQGSNVNVVILNIEKNLTTVFDVYEIMLLAFVSSLCSE